MTTKADFDAEEWSTLVEGPMMAAMQVVAAERGGTIRESLAVGRAYTEARKHHGESELIDQLVATPPALDPARLKEAGGDLKAHAAERLRAATEILSAKATDEDADAYRKFVLLVAEAAANANREGGFMGVGGKPVSANEQAAIDEIRRTLGA